MQIPNTAIIVLSVVLCAGSMRGDDGGKPIVLRGKGVSVEAQVVNGRLQERYLARSGHDWVEIATADGGKTTGPISLMDAAGAPISGTGVNISVTRNALVENLLVGSRRITRKVTIAGDGSWFHVSTEFDPAGSCDLHSLTDQFSFPYHADWCFSPSVKGFDPDAQYKAPVILAQSGRKAFGIVPDLAVLGRKGLMTCNHSLDLDATGNPLLTVGFVRAKLVSHSVYAPDPAPTWRADAVVNNAYYLLVTATADPAHAYREVVRFHWEQFGRAELPIAAEEQVGTEEQYRSLKLWDDWRNVVWNQESREKWLEVPLPDGSTGGGVKTNRWGPGPSVYLASWFNTLRTSYGMALYAKRTGNDELLRLAGQTLELALKTPGVKGAFKCIAVPTGAGKPTVWGAGDGSGGSTPNGFLGYDMSWTDYWLLKWRAAGLLGGDAVLPRCRQLAEFLMTRQEADGMLPTRFKDDGSVIEDLSTMVKAETGPVALFLLELYSQDPNPKYLESAKKGLVFLEKNVIPLRQWYDYETFWSCSPRKPAFDERTQQWTANDLALGQAVEAYLAAFRVTGDREFLNKGEALLDYLLLYQQCWTNPVLEGLTGKAMLLGGFTTQNSDTEWSDARQSQCGNILLDYYRATGKEEYLERGVSALRSQFPVAPSENWAHQGYGHKAGVSSFHWGTGSGMAGIEMEEDFLRDAVVDLAAGRGVGVNGLNVTGCKVDGRNVDLDINTPFDWPRKPVIVFRNGSQERKYSVKVNGTEAGEWKGSELEKGVAISVATIR